MMLSTRWVFTLAVTILGFNVALHANTVDIDPYPVTPDVPVLIQYDPAGRVLEGVPGVRLHYGFNDWAQVISPDPVMTWNAVDSVWELVVTAPPTASKLDMAFTDGSGTWDNNGGSDWHAYVLGTAAEQWTIDGELDADATLVAENNGRQLYAGIRGTTLYVASPPAASFHDHFIFISDAPGSQVQAPWDKAGTVAAWSAYIGNEVDSNWSGWFEAAGISEVTSGTWLEGTIDLQAEFGGMPSQIFIAHAAYFTDDFQPVSPGTQVPASLDGDFFIEANEYVGVSTASLLVGCFPQDLDADCDLDDDDFAIFAGCLNGPGTGSCAKSDFDTDNDVDLADYAEWQRSAGDPLSGTEVIAQDLGPNVTRFYDDEADIGSLPMSLSMETTPTVIGPATEPFAMRPFFFQSGDRHVALIDIDDNVSLYGTGEITGPLLRNGKNTEAWNTDAYAYGASNPSLYQSHPWVLGVRDDGTAFGVLADTTFRCQIDLSIEILFAAEGPEFPIYIFEGDTPQEVITRLTDFIGRIQMPPLWALGYQQSKYSYAPESQARNLAAEFRNRDIPCDVIWFDIDYMDGFKIFTFDPFGFPDPVTLNSDLHAMGYHTVWMIDPGAKVESGYHVYDQGTAGDHWTYDSNSNVYTGVVWPGPSHFPDFTRPETRTWWAGLYTDFMATGIDGVWNDLNEPGIFDGPGHSMPESNLHRGGGGLTPGTHSQYHNVYGMLMSRASHEGITATNPTKRPFVLSRASFIGGHRYAAMWTGDNIADWEHFGWTNAMTLNIGLSGQPFAGPDLGGFVGDGSGDLFARWMGTGVFMPFCRAHQDNTGMDKEPWSFGPAIEATSRTAIQRRYRLLPYLYTLFRESTLNGLPVMRPVFFADVTDPTLREEDAAFLLGADLMVVPNLSQNPGNAPTPSLPSGTWRTISLVGEDSANDVNQPDLRVRDGAIIPAGPVMEFTGEMPLDPLTLYVSLDGSGMAEGLLYEDAGEGYGYLAGDYRLAKYTAVQLGSTVTVSVETLEGTMTTPVRQVNVEVVTDSGVFTATGAEVANGVIANVAL